MPRFSELNKNNDTLGSKYSLNRAVPTSTDAKIDTDDIFTARYHISESLEASKVWFKKQKQLLRSKNILLFEDPNFPANDSSLFFSRAQERKYEWKRPKDICQNPQFIADGIDRFDVVQGELGDCWLLAAVSSLSMYPEIHRKVVPDNQEFDEDYVGAFMFRLWQFGTWIDIVVDDRLPSNKNRLAYLHSKDLNEFWSALLEKAYAKIAGSYEALRGGSSSEAMVDFTGGITEIIDLEKPLTVDLWDMMNIGSTKSSLMGCSIEAGGSEVESNAEKGLIKGHAYSITDVKTVTTKNGTINLIRIRNPWGNDREWTGAWSDKSEEWNEISEIERNRLGLTMSDDGEFWMSYEDFIHYFNKFEICHLSPESELKGMVGKPRTRWEMCQENAEWQKNVSAGGCRQFLDTFHLNPQFKITVIDPDENDDENNGTIIVGLMQKEMRSRRKEGADLFSIGYLIYQVKENTYDNTLLDTTYFRTHASIAKSVFCNIREISGRHKLPVGKYVIVPSTYQPGEEAKFLLRIFSEKPNDSTQIDEKTEIVKPTWKEDIPPEVKKSNDAYTERLQTAFKTISGNSEEIDAHELKEILDASFKRESFKFPGFSLETCRSMVAMMDVDQSGRMGFTEFKTMWDDLKLWKNVFKTFDVDKSGNFNSRELREALNYIGFKVSNRVFTTVIMRYADTEGVIPFDDYIILLVRLRTAFLTYKSQPKNAKEEAIFQQDEFIQCVLYQ